MTDELTAGDLCSRIVTIGYAGMPVSEAARLMRQHHVGCLVVVEKLSARESTVIGVLTDRDIAIGVVAADRDPHALKVEDLMTKDVVTAAEQDGVLDLVAAMRRRKVRRIPVLGPRNCLVGIVSLDDVLVVMAQQIQAVAAAVSAAASHERTEVP
jgi:CBS domain-containing protein